MCQTRASRPTSGADTAGPGAGPRTAGVYPDLSALFDALTESTGASRDNSANANANAGNVLSMLQALLGMAVGQETGDRQEEHAHSPSAPPPPPPQQQHQQEHEHEQHRHRQPEERSSHPWFAEEPVYPDDFGRFPPQTHGFSSEARRPAGAQAPRPPPSCHRCHGRGHDDVSQTVDAARRFVARSVAVGAHALLVSAAVLLFCALVPHWLVAVGLLAAAARSLGWPVGRLVVAAVALNLMLAVDVVLLKVVALFALVKTCLLGRPLLNGPFWNERLSHCRC